MFETAMRLWLVLGQQHRKIDTFGVASLDVRHESAMLGRQSRMLIRVLANHLWPRPNRRQAEKFQRNEELKK
jgi:hypothetical protein